jgi:hypothetical protein
MGLSGSCRTREADVSVAVWPSLTTVRVDLAIDFVAKRHDAHAHHL